MIIITKFEEKYTQDIIDLVLHFQNDGTRPLLTVYDQLDLLNIKKEYIDKGGNFWIAKDNEKLIGSIGLMPINKDIAIMKNFFVYEDYQGEPHHTGQKLYSEFLKFAKSKGFKNILLDTPRNTVRAHKFYEKAGFRKVSENDLPIKFNHPYKGSEICDFFILEL